MKKKNYEYAVYKLSCYLQDFYGMNIGGVEDPVREKSYQDRYGVWYLRGINETTLAKVKANGFVVLGE
tara:strand:+ start:153 stop:356 length:204 start_codon:yes stop_codon:yes gene_type:complete